MTAVARTREYVEREYGREKWPAVQRLIEAEIAADGDTPSLGRVHYRVVRGYAYPNDALAPLDAVISGAQVTLPSNLGFGALRSMVADAVVDACTPDTELILELGSGWGWHILATWLSGGPRGVRYVGAELTEAGRGCSQTLAALDPELDFEALAFDYKAPDLSSLGRVREAVVFTDHSIEQIAELPAAVLDAIRGVADRVTCLHFEPVGWQLDEPLAHGSSQAYAERHDYNRNLVALVRDAERAGSLRIEAILPEIIGVNPHNATTLVAWRSPAGDG